MFRNEKREVDFIGCFVQVKFGNPNADLLDINRYLLVRVSGRLCAVSGRFFPIVKGLVLASVFPVVYHRQFLFSFTFGSQVACVRSQVVSFR